MRKIAGMVYIPFPMWIEGSISNVVPVGFDGCYSVVLSP